ncbi:hypothetical protein EBT25_16605 [bacterium]|nr:hypothetical protein [bacterium]
MAGESAERQENGIVKAIKAAVQANQKNPVTVIAGKITVMGVTDANKYTGRQEGGSEPYTDIVLTTTKGPVNLSCKGPSAPSLAGGGLKGLELAVPGITAKFMKAAYAALTSKKKLRPGDKVPDVFGEITGNTKTKIVVGNKAMGGPIDYMYIGPMDVSAPYDKKKNEVKMNGSLYPAVQYARTHKLFFRLRARREDQRFDPDAKDNRGVPKIYGKSPSKGDSAGRIVVTDSVPSTGVIVKI